MARHRQTAAGIVQGLGEQAAQLPMETLAGLNENQFRGLLTPLQQSHPELWHDTRDVKRDDYFNMRQALAYWMDGTIASDGLDSWSRFCQRILTAFEMACGQATQSKHKGTSD